MTTIFSFVPGKFSTFTFQPILDGIQYNAEIRWNLQGQRWYIMLTDNLGNNIFTLPLIGSMNHSPINNITWEDGAVTVEMVNPHYYGIGQVANLTYTENIPDAYNGQFITSVIDQLTLQYFLQDDPGSIITVGFASYDINLAGGYFNSTLVYREDNNWFEVNP
jgi:hypothetical protein